MSRPGPTDRSFGRAGWVRVDCQLHTMWSGDATTTLDELAARVAAVGLDVVCITDHHTIEGALLAAERDIGARVIVGEEVRTRSGELIGLFLTERIPYVLAAEDAVARIRDQGGLVYAPHPLDRHRRGLGEQALEELAAGECIDVVEVFNAKTHEGVDNERAAEAAQRLGLPAGAGSDAHDPEGVGAAYIEMPDFDGPRSFLAGLRSARVVGELREHARRYLPRPS